MIFYSFSACLSIHGIMKFKDVNDPAIDVRPIAGVLD